MVNKMITLPPYDGPNSPVPQVTPFTYRDGVTMLKKLELLKRYINKVLVPFVNNNFEEVQESFTEDVNKLIESVNKAINDVLGHSVEVQDIVVVGIVNNVNSLTRKALDNIYYVKSQVDTKINDLFDEILALNNRIAIVENLTPSLVRKKMLNVGNNADPLIEWTGIEGAIGFHITNGPNFNAAYLMGLGNDYGSKPGLLIANKAGGTGVYLDNHPTATGPGMFGVQRSAASLFDFAVAKDNAGALMVIRVDSTVNTPGALASFYGKNNAEVMSILADSVNVRKTMRVLPSDDGPAAELVIQSAPSAASSVSNGAWHTENGVTFAAASGSNGSFFKTRIAAIGDRLRLQAGGGGGFGSSAPSWSDVISITSDGKIGFYGSNPTVKQTNVPVTVDAIHAALRSLGLIS